MSLYGLLVFRFQDRVVVVEVFVVKLVVYNNLLSELLKRQRGFCYLKNNALYQHYYFETSSVEWPVGRAVYTRFFMCKLFAPHFDIKSF